jgi:predicted DNA-binding transcriptional regulator YafY
MPETKLPSIRYRVLDQCFSDFTRTYRIDDLHKACNKVLADHLGELPDTVVVSMRTIQDDIAFMQLENSYNIPLEIVKAPEDKRINYYRYSDQNFSINKQPLSQQDAEVIRNAVETILLFKGRPQFDWIESASTLIKSWTIQQDQKLPTLIFDENKDLQGTQYIQPLFHATRARASIKLQYKPFNKPTENHTISPYLLKQFNNRWFILCKSDQYEYLINLALDRIQSVEQEHSKFVEYPADSPEDFFEDIVGVTRNPQPIEKNEILAHADLYPYLETKPIHSSQTPIQRQSNDQWKKITVDIIPNYEFYSLILSHGSRIKIVGPEKVKQDFMKIVSQTYSQYF